MRLRGNARRRAAATALAEDLFVGDHGDALGRQSEALIDAPAHQAHDIRRALERRGKALGARDR